MKQVSRIHRAALSALGCLGVVVAAWTASASPYDAALARAIAAKERAVETNDPARWEDALRLFQEADSLGSTRESAYEMGYAAAILRQYDLAVEAYETAVELGLAGSARAKADAFLSEHRPQMAEVDVRGPTRARVLVRGVERGVLPLSRPVKVFPGRLTIEVITPAHERTSYEIELGAGERKTVQSASGSPDVPLFPMPARQPPGATTPRPPMGPPPPAQGSSRHAPTAAWVLLGGGATVTLLSAVGLPLSYASIDRGRAELKDACYLPVADPDACPSAMPDRWDEAQAHSDAIATWKAVRTLSWVGLATGLVSAAAGGIWLLQPRPPARGQYGLPTVGWGPRAVRVGYQGSF